MLVLGFDPGLTGAFASFDGENLFVVDIPIFEEKKKGTKNGKKRTVNTAGLVDLMDVAFSCCDHAYIELVSAMPDQGVTSMFNFGKAAGIGEGVIAASHMPFTPVSSTKWKLDMGLNSDGERSRKRALELFPKYAHYFARKMDHNRAEAALLAYYGWCILTGRKAR